MEREMKIFIYPANSLILYDLVRRHGHKPLAIMREIASRVRNPEIDSPPNNITLEDVRRGLKYCAVEVPSGVRGRLALLGKLIEEADAAIIIEDPEISFGCSGCARTNEYVKYLVYERGIPYITVRYPRDQEEAVAFVQIIAEFLDKLKTAKVKRCGCKDSSNLMRHRV